jgi:hypothetical protein
MRFKGRLKKLELVIAPPAAQCDCPHCLTYFTLIDGTRYPPHVPCLRGKCIEKRMPNQPPPVTAIIISPIRRTKDGYGRAGCNVRVHDFRTWDPATDRPRLRIIVWRDAETGRLRYYGPPRWWELETEPPLIQRGVGVPATDEEVVEELRRTDDTPPIDSPCFRHFGDEKMDEDD